MPDSNLLVNALQFQIRKDGSEWAYNWEFSTCGTAMPTPRDSHATFWMTCNNRETIFDDLQDFFRMARSKLGNLRLQQRGKNQVEVVSETQGVLLKGSMHGNCDANVGRYTKFEAMTEEGCELIIKCCTTISWGYRAFLFHDQVTREVDKDLKLVVTTGLGPDLNTNIDGDKEDLSTKFELILNQETVTKKEEERVVGRCLLSYHDDSFDPSMGPTIEMIAIHQDFRGKGLLPLLWFWVKTFVEDSFTIECLNKEAPLNHLMIKATKLSNTPIEEKDGKSITDKEFFYNHLGFSVRKQLGVLAATKMGAITSSTVRPLDEEAVLYIPLLTQGQLRERTERRSMGEEINGQGWTNQRGARCCGFCQKIDFGLLRCSRCGDVYYCNRECQKKDWKRHKHWCGKSRAQVQLELEKQANPFNSS